MRGRVVQNKVGEIDRGRALTWGLGKTVWGLVGHVRVICLSYKSKIPLENLKLEGRVANMGRRNEN